MDKHFFVIYLDQSIIFPLCSLKFKITIIQLGKERIAE